MRFPQNFAGLPVLLALRCGHTWARLGFMSTTPSQRGTQHQKFRMDADVWAEFGSDAAMAGKDRSVLIRELVAWWMRTPGAKLPERLPR